MKNIAREFLQFFLLRNRWVAYASLMSIRLGCRYSTFSTLH